MTVGGTRTTWVMAVAAALVATTTAAQLDPERNHLTCYPVKGETIRRTVTLENDLGTESIASLKPVQICAPTRKTAQPAGTDPLPGIGVPYFTCYKFKVKGKRAKRPLTLTDQFGTVEVTVARPNLLCAPAVIGDGGTTTTTTTGAATTTLPATTSTTATPTTTTAAPTTTSPVTTTSTTTGTLIPTTTSTVPDTTTSSTSSTTTTDVPSTTVDTTTTTTDTTTTAAVTTTTDTTTTLPSCSLAEGDPQLACTGVCPPGFSCLYTVGQGCGCSPDASACPNFSTGQCGGGLCPGGLKACQDDGLGGCACVDIG